MICNKEELKLFEVLIGKRAVFTFRGGSWFLYSRSMRVARHHQNYPDYSLIDLGFRIAHEPRRS